jgi:membrane associated rhomboid family serine protease
VFTIFTSMFIHGGFMHLAGNMMFLWVFGDNIEDRLGHVKYLVFYLVAGVAATLSQWVISTDSQVPLIGASGAISGVLGAYLVVYPNNKVKALIIFYLITVVEMRAMWILGAWFIWQLIQGSLSLGVSDSVSVAFFAHIGGFVAGMALAVAYKLVLKEPLLPGSARVQPWDRWYQAGRPMD